MKLTLVFLSAGVLAAQQTANESPKPSTEQQVKGSIDAGYRWTTGVGGDFQSYRSVVNLGEGPKLFGVDLSLTDLSKRFFDRFDIRGSGWGGDPYNTARIDASRQGVYSFSVDYRNIAYFNFLPSYANPGTATGLFFNQRSFDIRRRLADLELELRPGKRLIPYLAFTHNSGSGSGITDFVTENINEYPVSTRLRDQSRIYRGGIRLELNRFHSTIEQGGTTFKDDQQVLTRDRNPGNRTTPLLGQQLFLSNLQQSYGVRGDSVYTKALFTASPAHWMDVSGQFVYSRPQTDTNYIQNNTGEFGTLTSLLFFTGQQDLLSSEARQPHTSGNAGFELRPLRRVRILESWMTDRLHNAATALLAEALLLSGGGNQTQTLPAADRLVFNYNQQQIDVLYDLTSRLTLRGGHRFTWGDARVRAPLLSGGTALEAGELRRQTGLASVNYRAGQNLNMNAELEAASGDRTYFRTSLQDYERLRARARYQLSAAWGISASFLLLNNQNPAPTVNYDFLNRENAVSVFWTPTGGKRISVLADYSRSSLRSDITYVVPQTRERERSFYRENAHGGSVLADLALPRGGAKASLGGAFFTSSGSRPTHYYQPLAKLSVPVQRHLQWNTEWRWYALSEHFYRYEGFRTHLFVTGFRLMR